ncbi:MAG: hypothetical protein M3512_14165 [Bacteroidota bacterium]|nr:hypothetical protein [Bacteroidota bacterium]
MERKFFKNRKFFLALSLILVFFLDCTDRPQRIAGDYETEKTELSARIDSRLESLNNDLERIRESANEAGENIKADFRVKLSELEEERQRLQEQKQRVEIATVQEWEDSRNEVLISLEEIEKNIVQKVESLETELQE